MKRIMFLIGLLSLFSCSKNYDRFYVDPDLAPYYEDFVTAGKFYGRDHSTGNLVVEFGDVHKFVTNSRAIGICKRELEFINEFGSLIQKTHFYPRVVIDRETFFSLDDYSKRALIFHELGHCILNRDHDESINEQGYVKSIMYPSLVTQRLGIFYQFLEDYYIEELFSPQSAHMTAEFLTPTVKDQQKIGSGVSDEQIKTNIFVLTQDGCENSLSE